MKRSGPFPFANLLPDRAWGTTKYEEGPEARTTMATRVATKLGARGGGDEEVASSAPATSPSSSTARTRVPAWRQLKRAVRGLSPWGAAGKALRVLEESEGGHGLKPPIDVEALARRLDVRVLHVGKPGWSGAVRSDENQAVVWLNAHDPIVRQRFTLAHEIGHLLLHPTGQLFRDAGPSEGGTDPVEVQANKFAAELLMPLFLLEPIATGPRRRSAAELAELFQVSLQSMEIQLSRLAW